MSDKKNDNVLTRLGKIRTPKGTAAFAFLGKPDNSFGKPRYRINVFFDKADPEFKEFITKLKALNVEFGKSKGRKPNPIPVKLTNEKLAGTVNLPVGTPFIEMTSKYDENSKPIPVFDASAEKIDTYVYGGDIVRAEGNVSGWELPAGVGIKVYLGAVQLLQSNWKGGKGASFEAEEEFLGDNVTDPQVTEETLEEEDVEEDDLFADDPVEEKAVDPTDSIL
jgi:hypothetical protein